MARFCSSCGTEVGDNAAFCPKCGKATGAQATTGSGAAAAPSAATTAPAAGAGLQDNIAGLLAYIFIAAIIFLVVEPYNKNKFIRFHAFQAISIAVIGIVVHAILMASLIGAVLLIPFNLLLLVVTIICMIKAYQGQIFKLLVIGEFAEKQANG